MSLKIKIMVEQNSLQYPTEELFLPSQGKIYPIDSFLSGGKIEMKYLTSKEEDILTNQALIQKQTVLDKLFQSLIVSPVNYEDILLLDKDAIMLQARLLAYGKDYTATATCPMCQNKQEENIDLTKIEYKDVDMSIFNNINNFPFTLPSSKITITFKLLTRKDELNIHNELQVIKKLKKNTSDLSTRMKYIITSVDGNSEDSAIRKFVDSERFLSSDSFALRKHISEMSPGVDLNISFTCENCGHDGFVRMPMEVQFFWPDARL